MKKKLAFAFVLIFLAIFAFRHFFIAVTVDLAVNILTGEKLQYEKRRWEEGRLIYEKLSFGEAVYAERGELEFRTNKTPFYLEARLLLSGLDIVVDLQKEKMAVFSALIPHRFFVMKLDIEDGRAAIIPNDQPILFTFLSGSTPEKIGKCNFNGFITADVSASNGKFDVLWDVEKAPVEQLAHLVQIFLPGYLSKWQGFKGDAEIHGKTVFSDKGEAIELIAALEANEFAASNYTLGVFGKSKNLQIDIQYPEPSLKVNIDGGELHFAEPLIPDGWAITEAKGSFVLEQGQEPSIQLKGFIIRGDHTYPLQLHGEGTFQPEKEFWMEGEIEVASSSAAISLCRLETDKFVLQADIRSLTKDGLALLWDWGAFFTPYTEEFNIPSGSLSARVTTWWEEKRLKKIQFEDLKATELYIESSSFPIQSFVGQVTGSFVIEGNKIKQADLEIKEGMASYSQWHVAEVAAQIKIENDLFVDSQLKGVFAGIPGDFNLAGPILSPKVAAHLSAYPSQWVAAFRPAEQNTYSPIVHLFATYHEKKISGNFASDGDVLQFSWDREGLFKTERLSSATLAPFLRALKLDYSVLGNFSIENMEGHFAFLEDGLRLEEVRGRCSGPITGVFSQASLSLRSFWSTKLHFEEGVYSQLKELTFDLEYDAAANIAMMRNCSVKVGQTPISSQMIRLKDKRLDFDLKVGQWLALSGAGKRSSNGGFHLNIAGGEDKKASFEIIGTRADFDFKWKEIKGCGKAVVAQGGISCDFLSIEGLIPKEYQLKSVSPVQFSFNSGLGKFHFAAIEKATQKIIGEIKGDSFDRINCSYKSLKAAFGVKADFPQLILQNGEDRLLVVCDPWSIRGRFQGMEINLFQGKGSIKVVDGDAASQFLSYSWLKEISNIELDGIWNKGGFKGEILGKDIEYKGKKIQELKGEAEISSEKAIFKHVTLTDPSAGSLFLKQVAYENGQIYIPLVKIQNYRPNKEKPFLIRTLVLSDLKMVAGDFKSLQGRGSFNFTNGWKKESSIFDAPIEMLKNLGLDLALFTPVGGEVSCLLKNGKIYLTDLKNAYSEGERSQFFLAEEFEPSYIDFEGLFHINLRMKQNVVLKFAEPFELTIRGTLEKPEYGLR